MVKKRCGWAGVSNPLMLEYHDREWGVPVHDDGKHFEFLVLEGAQAGLNWSIILNKREGYRRAFSGFDPSKVARYTDKRVQKLLLDPGIIRNRQKIESAIRNARAFLTIQEEFGTFDAYAWRFVGGQPKVNRWKATKQIPASSAESDAFSKDLKQRGFSFVGSTIIYAHMQAVGMVNDHLVGCFRYAALHQADPAAAAPARARPSRRPDPATRSLRQSTPSRPAGRTTPRPRR
jgi:DNA-3-methyladenine glycosylase I